MPDFLFDNNRSPDLVNGMKGFGEPAKHATDVFDGDPGDEDLIRWVGEHGHFLVTRDKKQMRRPAEADAYRRYNVGVFLLGGKNLGRCDLIRQVVRNWTKLKESAATTPRPFIYRVRPNGEKLEPVPL